MKKIYFLLAILVAATAFTAMAQDTTFYFRNYKKTSKSLADTYIRYHLCADGRYSYSIRSKKQDILLSDGFCLTLDSPSYVGNCRYYGNNGMITSEGICVNNKAEGLWTSYYDSNTQVWHTDMMSKGISSGELRSYYKSGKLQRIEQDSAGVAISGKCYSEDGKEIAFSPFSTIPYPPLDILLYNITSQGKSGNRSKVLKLSMDRYGMQTDIADSVFSYNLYTPIDHGMYKMEQLAKNSLTLIAECSAVKLVHNVIEVKEGYYKSYDDSGNVEVVGKYTNDLRDGTWMFYYSGTQSIWCITQYKNGVEDGSLTSYYRDGNIKRKEELRDGKSMGGKCFDKDGKEIPFTPFLIPTTSPTDIRKFLAEYLKYPEAARQAGVEGDVIIAFDINEDGSLSNMRAVNRIGNGCEEEAMRVMKTLSKGGWKPSICDDKVRKDRPYYQLIQFRLR